MGFAMVEYTDYQVCLSVIKGANGKPFLSSPSISVCFAFVNPPAEVVEDTKTEEEQGGSMLSATTVKLEGGSGSPAGDGSLGKKRIRPEE
jgi:hypothetical protein